MKLYNTFSSIIVCLLVVLSSFGQAPNKTLAKQASQESLKIYERIRNQICNCISNTMRDNKPSTTLDSCYQVTLTNYRDTIKALGFDVSVHDEYDGKTEFLLNQIRLYRCREIDRLLHKELAEEEAKKLLFKGEFVSQKKLETGEYEIILKDNKTKVLNSFKAKRPFDESLVKNFLPGYELTIEYEIARNLKTNKDELYIKEYGTVSVLGTQRTTNQ
jgi:hypothetical protein